MKQVWGQDELIEDFTLNTDEWDWLSKRTGYNQLGLAVLLKIFQYEGRIPDQKKVVAIAIVEHIAIQLGLSPKLFDHYQWQGRTAYSDRKMVRDRLGFRETSIDDSERLAIWLSQHLILQQDQRIESLLTILYQQCRTLKLEPPTKPRLERIVRSGIHQYEQGFFEQTWQQLPAATCLVLDNLLYVDESIPGEDEFRTILGWLKKDPGQVSVRSVQETADRLRRLQTIELPENLFANTAHRVVKTYAQRAATERPYELRRHSQAVRFTLLAAFCWVRQQEITDQMVELFIQIVHKINAKAEKRVEQKIIAEIRGLQDDKQIVLRLLQAAHDNPDGRIKDVLYPIADQAKLKTLIEQQKAASRRTYERRVYYRVRASYQYHYRQMLPVLLDVLEFRSSNQPLMIAAIKLVQHYIGSRRQHYPLDEAIPITGVVPAKWLPFVVETDDQGQQRVNRINYEICVLQLLRDHLRCKAVWVVGAKEFRNPDDDLPADFEQQRDYYYQLLDLPHDARQFIQNLQQAMHEALTSLDRTIGQNPKVRVSSRDNGWIHLSPSPAQPEAPFLPYLKAEIKRRWRATSLLDVLKETDLRIDFTNAFHSAAAHERLDPQTRRKRLLLCLYGLGSNTGLSSMAMGEHGESYDDLRYVKRRFIDKDGLREAIAQVVNSTLEIRQPYIWGEGTTSSCASDSRQFATHGHNLRTEWHARYRKKGVMIYWHVEKNSLAVYSQLKSPTSSEVAMMMEGILRHQTQMDIERNYVDTHGQSEVAFAFCQLLGFDLMPRFKRIHKQKLSRPYTGQPLAYPNLLPIMVKPIDWKLIEQQYDAIVQYAIALLLGTASAEALLRRFTRNSPQHPAYQALGELGRAIKTIFLCRYLHSESLRREINAGLNTVEQWHSANLFIFFGNQSELTSSRLDDQLVSALSLHLLQNSLIYINTLMLQQVLAEPTWYNRMTDADWRALTPLFWLHINPYGIFRLDLSKRLPLQEVA